MTERITSSPFRRRDGVIRTMKRGGGQSTYLLLPPFRYHRMYRRRPTIGMATLWELTSIWSGQYRVNASIERWDPAFYLIVGGGGSPPERAGALTMKHRKIRHMRTRAHENARIARFNIIWHGKLHAGERADHRRFERVPLHLLRDAAWGSSSQKRIKYMNFFILFKSHLFYPTL